MKPNARFFINSTFISNALLKLAENQANAKQHPEAKLSLFGNYSHSPSTLSSKRLYDYMINHYKNEDENQKKIT